MNYFLNFTTFPTNSTIYKTFLYKFQLIACVIFAILVSIPSGNTLLPRQFDIISFGYDTNNDIIDDEFVIPKPSPVNTKKKGKTASGEDCFCFIQTKHAYLPQIVDVNCICKKVCCKDRGNQYLPPVDCEICPKCICDTKTFTLINKESGGCPACR